MNGESEREGRTLYCLRAECPDASLETLINQEKYVIFNWIYRMARKNVSVYLIHM